MDQKAKRETEWLPGPGSRKSMQARLPTSCWAEAPAQLLSALADEAGQAFFSP